MNKKILLGIALLILATFVSADSISNYVVPSSVPLNQPVTATGIYFDGNGNTADRLCDFYFFDSTGNTVYRATAQYTTAVGRFAMNGVTMTEPRFVRGQVYDLHTECGTAIADANFSVGQKQEAFSVLGYNFYPQGTVMDFIYLRDNGLLVFFLFIMIFVFVALVVLGAKNLIG